MLKSTYRAAKNFYEGLPENDAFIAIFVGISLLVLFLGHFLAAMAIACASVLFIMILDAHQRSWARKNRKIEEELAAILRDNR